MTRPQRAASVRHASTANRPAPTPWPAALLACLAVLAPWSAAQERAQPLDALLPSTTVVALHLTAAGGSEAVDLRELWRNLARAADYEAVAPTFQKLTTLLGAELAGSRGTRGSVSGLQREFGALGRQFGELERELDELVGVLAAACPPLAGAVEGGSARLTRGSLVVGLTLPRGQPAPGVVALFRPSDGAAWSDFYGHAVDCFAADSALEQDGVALDFFAHDAELPLVSAAVAGTYVFSTDVELVRTAVRLAGGAAEPSHHGSEIGRLSSRLMQAGTGVVLNTALLADGLEAYAGMAAQGEAAALVAKLLASLRTLSGLALNATLDDEGLLLTSVMTIDDDHGERELAALLRPAAAGLAPPALVPTGAATLASGRLSLGALVDWLDSWLAAAAPLLGQSIDVRSLAAQSLALDLDTALLDWVGQSWHYAALEVPATNALTYLRGTAGVLTVPVVSEEAARVGIDQLTTLLEALVNQAAPLMSDLDGRPGSRPPAAPGWDDLVARTSASHRGVAYERWRVGPLADVGVAVLGGHLVLANPAATMNRVIDVHLGAPNALRDARLGELASDPAGNLLGYQFIDLPRYLRGAADLSDVLAAPAATALRAAAREMVGYGPAAGAARDDVPTFEELVGLGDFVTRLLDAAAARTGVAIGRSEVVDGAVWSTFRLPLR